MKFEALKTEDKKAALEFISKHLESKERLNAGIQNLGGVYTVEVSRPTSDCADGADKST